MNKNVLIEFHRPIRLFGSTHNDFSPSRRNDVTWERAPLGVVFTQDCGDKIRTFEVPWANIAQITTTEERAKPEPKVGKPR